MIKVLLLEDDFDLNQIITRHLMMNRFDVSCASNGEEGLHLFDSTRFDLIISDIMMPKMDGYTFAKKVREDNQTIPIIFLTARNDFDSKEKGFHTGIDDYIVKPVDLRELDLRIEAILRRVDMKAKKVLKVGNLTLNENEVSVKVNDTPVSITLREFQILFQLLSYPGQVFTRSRLTEEFSGYESESTLRSVDVHITNIRNKIKNAEGFTIQTVRGLGYKAVIL